MVSRNIFGSPGRNSARTGVRKSSTMPPGPRWSPAPGTLRIWGFQVACACSMPRTPSRSPALRVAKNCSTSRSLSVSAATLIAILQHSLRGEAHGELLRAVTDAGHPGLGLPGWLETTDVTGESTEQRLGLEPGENAAHAGMDTRPPSEVA